MRPITHVLQVRRRVIVGVIVLLLFAILATTALTGLASQSRPAAAAPATHRTSAPARAGAYYLALGDSAAFGEQGNGDNSHGYADAWTAEMQTNNAALKLIDYGCPYETTSTFIQGGCPGLAEVRAPFPNPPLQTQLAAALTWIAQHPGQSRPITIDLGTNDFLPCLQQTDATKQQSCITVTLARERINLYMIIGALAGAAGNPSSIFFLTQWDPYQNAPDVMLARESVQVIEALNTIIAEVAHAYGVHLVDVGNAVYHLDQYPNGNNPYVCQLSAFCTTGDTHSNTAGYAAIAALLASSAGY